MKYPAALDDELQASVKNVLVGGDQSILYDSTMFMVAMRTVYDMIAVELQVQFDGKILSAGMAVHRLSQNITHSLPQLSACVHHLRNVSIEFTWRSIVVHIFIVRPYGKFYPLEIGN